MSLHMLAQKTTWRPSRKPCTACSVHSIKMDLAVRLPRREYSTMLHMCIAHSPLSQPYPVLMRCDCACAWLFAHLLYVFLTSVHVSLRMRAQSSALMRCATSSHLCTRGHPRMTYARPCKRQREKSEKTERDERQKRGREGDKVLQ